MSTAAPKCTSPQMPQIRRVGHKGAALLAPGNTLAAFDAALQVGVDMIEFDVISERRGGGGRLVVAHDHQVLAQPEELLTLDAALAHLARPELPTCSWTSM